MSRGAVSPVLLYKPNTRILKASNIKKNAVFGVVTPCGSCSY
jgi:hypothetical protein